MGENEQKDELTPEDGGQPQENQQLQAAQEPSKQQVKSKDDPEYWRRKVGRQGNRIGALEEQNRLLQGSLAQLQTKLSQQNPEDGFGEDGFDYTNPEHFKIVVAEVLDKRLANLPAITRQTVAQTLDERGLEGDLMKQMKKDVEFLTSQFDASEEDIQLAVQYADRTGIQSITESYEKLFGGSQQIQQQGADNQDKQVPGDLAAKQESDNKRKPGGKPQIGNVSGVGETHNRVWASKIAAMSLADIERQYGVGKALGIVQEAKRVIGIK